ncbi:MAG: glycerophosphodiester phosphodiesterase [Candidatus Limnocylindrales bacterium]
MLLGETGGAAHPGPPGIVLDGNALVASLNQYEASSGTVVRVAGGEVTAIDPGHPQRNCGAVGAQGSLVVLDCNGSVVQGDTATAPGGWPAPDDRVNVKPEQRWTSPRTTGRTRAPANVRSEGSTPIWPSRAVRRQFARRRADDAGHAKRVGGTLRMEAGQVLQRLDVAGVPSDAPSPTQRGARSAEFRPLRLAHRGDHRRLPENSLAAFRAALAIPGCDGLEFDVRLSHDGVPVVLHDATLARVQGRPERAADLTAAELDPLGVPTLAAVLGAAPAPAFLDIELKEDPGMAVIQVLRAARGPALDFAAVSSFEPIALERVRAAAPTWRCWLNADDMQSATLALARDLGCAGVAAEWHAINRRAVERARAMGLEVVAWTVRRRATFRRLAELGVVGACVEGAALGR